MEVVKDTGKQEKRRMVIRGAGSSGGGIVVWGGVAVIAASFVVASVSAFISWRKRNDETTRKDDELNKRNEEADTVSIEHDAQPLEIIGKMREDKANHEIEAPNKDEEKNAEEATNGIIQKHQLAKGQVNDEEIKAEEEAILAVPKSTYIEPNREPAHEFGEKVVKKDEEVAEEIEVETPMSHVNEEESDENSSIDEDGGDIAEKVTYLKQMEKQHEHNGNEIVERDERVVETAFQYNRFTDEGNFEITEKESVHGEEELQYEGKVMVEKEEESSETNEEDEEEGEEEEEEEEEEESEGTGDSSMESNADAIWPAEAMEGILMEIKQRKIDNQISEEKTDDYKKVETEQRSLKNDNIYATDRCEIEDSGGPVFSSRKGYMKELLLDLSRTRISIWAIVVFVLALAAPLVLSPEGIMKLSLVMFFVVSVSRALKTII